MDSKRAVVQDTFDEFIEKGYIEEAGIGPDGERIGRLVDFSLSCWKK